MSGKSLIASVAAAVAAVLTVSCSQGVYMLDMETRGPSESGMSLQGKSVALIYLESADGSDSLYNNRVADALAYKIEKEYFGGEEAVGVYNLVKDPEGHYSSVDTLSQYIMMLDKDVVLILDTPDIVKKESNDNLSLSSVLYGYDSMSDLGLVTTVGRTSVSSMDNAVNRSSVIGGALAAPMIGEWVKESFPVIYYDDASSKWIRAIELADEMKWAEAIDIWMQFATAKDAAKASCAKYNIALGCYILGEYDLAYAWLKSSDDTYPISLNKDLREKIEKKMKG